MDTTRFTSLERFISMLGPRRRMLQGLAVAPFAIGLRGLLVDDSTSAKDRRRRRKQRHKRRKHAGGRKFGCRRKPTAKVCADRCGVVKNRKTCGKRVDCGSCADNLTCCGSTECLDLRWDAANCGACGNACPGDHICVDGACQPCTVTCKSTDHVCPGIALQAAIDQGGAVYICPGHFTGTFTIAEHAATTIVGAGMGDDPARNTILDAQRAGRTLFTGIFSNATVRAMRITGGGSVLGGGIFVSGGAKIVMARCAVVDNTNSGVAGGMYFVGIQGTVEDCLFSENSATDTGGAIFSDGVTLTLRGTTITKNTAQFGGGLGMAFGEVILTGGTQISGNTANATDGGGGIRTFDNSTLTIASDATVINNIPNDCLIEGTLNGSCG